MSPHNEIEQLMAEARYYRERVALMRAKAYRGRTTSDVRLHALERALGSAERRMREARLREPS